MYLGTPACRKEETQMKQILIFACFAFLSLELFAAETPRFQVVLTEAEEEFLADLDIGRANLGTFSFHSEDTTEGRINVYSFFGPSDRALKVFYLNKLRIRVEAGPVIHLYGGSSLVRRQMPSQIQTLEPERAQVSADEERRDDGLSCLKILISLFMGIYSQNS